VGCNLFITITRWCPVFTCMYSYEKIKKKTRQNNYLLPLFLVSKNIIQRQTKGPGSMWESIQFLLCEGSSDSCLERWERFILSICN